jgi:SpoIIAA-like
MSVAIEKEADGKILLVCVSDKLTRDDYRRFVPEIEEQVMRHGRIRIMFEMRDFHGWTVGAMWEDVKFDVKHFSDIERLAIVGEKAWERGMAAFCRPFTRAKMRYFHRNESGEAWRWLEADLPVGSAN